jgi:hypothetical protein
MRRSHHTEGSPAAQSTLLALAGWTPSRRSILTGLLSIPTAAAVTSLPAVAAIPDAALEQNPYSICSGVPASSVSPRMAQLVADFARLTTALDAIDPDADPMAWDRAAEPRAFAWDALVSHQPVTVADLAALVEFTEEDTDRFVMRQLAEDATMLAGSSK